MKWTHSAGSLKTVKPYKVAQKSLQVGRVLCDQGKGIAQKDLYLITGLSYDSVALIRLFQQADLNNVLAGRCYRILRKTTLAAMLDIADAPLYADITKLITREINFLLPRLDSRTGCFIHKKDMECIITLVKEVNTISAHIKDKYLQL